MESPIRGEIYLKAGVERFELNEILGESMKMLLEMFRRIFHLGLYEDLLSVTHSCGLKQRS